MHSFAATQKTENIELSTATADDKVQIPMPNATPPSTRPSTSIGREIAYDVIMSLAFLETVLGAVGTGIWAKDYSKGCCCDNTTYKLGITAAVGTGLIFFMGLGFAFRRCNNGMDHWMRFCKQSPVNTEDNLNHGNTGEMDSLLHTNGSKHNP